jgi:hypothetical protein
VAVEVKWDNYGGVRLPYIEVPVAGRLARVESDINRVLLEEGILLLPNEFRGLVPVVERPADPADGRPVAQEYDTATRDPLAVSMAREFVSLVDEGDLWQR